MLSKLGRQVANDEPRDALMPLIADRGKIGSKITSNDSFVKKTVKSL